MPLHDWTIVSPNTFHAFHVAWVASLQQVLNRGVLPRGYYALAEQTSPPIGPDVLTLHKPDHGQNGGRFDSDGGTAVMKRKPRVRYTASGSDRHARPQRRISIRHNSDHRLIAIIEVVSPGNKAGERAIRIFIEKLLGAIRQGLHALLIDPFPFTKRDSGGIHVPIWKKLVGSSIHSLSRNERCLASIEVGEEYTAYVQPAVVGNKLPNMPLFLEPGHFVEVPLEQSYRLAWDGLPEEIQVELSAR